MAPDPSSKCAICGDPITSKCSGCKSKLYCGKACQAKDWRNHKKFCKDLQLEKTLRRVAELIHQAYLTFRENTFNTPIIKIEETKDALVIYDGDHLARPEYFVNFPYHLIKDDAMKNAVLCWCTCNEPFAWMHSLILKLVDGTSCIRLSNPVLSNCGIIGLKVTVDEVKVTLRQMPRKTTVIRCDGTSADNWPGTRHFLLRITSTQTGTRWGLGISGAQYGIGQTFWKWHEHEKRFIDHGRTLEIYPLGTNKALFAALAELEGSPSMI
jgi:hypothetical protein